MKNTQFVIAQTFISVSDQERKQAVQEKVNLYLKEALKYNPSVSNAVELHR